jgi:hypothetical protein
MAMAIDRPAREQSNRVPVRVPRYRQESWGGLHVGAMPAVCRLDGTRSTVRRDIVLDLAALIAVYADMPTAQARTGGDSPVSDFN